MAGRRTPARDSAGGSIGSIAQRDRPGHRGRGRAGRPRRRRVVVDDGETPRWRRRSHEVRTMRSSCRSAAAHGARRVAVATADASATTGRAQLMVTPSRVALERPRPDGPPRAQREVDVGFAATPSSTARGPRRRSRRGSGAIVAASVRRATSPGRHRGRARRRRPVRRTGRTLLPILRPSRPAATSRSWIGDGRSRSGRPRPSQTPCAAARLTSMPVRSISSNGPIGKPAARSAASMASTDAGARPRASGGPRS